MTPTCDRCGRPIAAAGDAAGARTEATCSCDRVPAVLAGAGALQRSGRDAGPLPAPREGSLEVDPWSLPVPEGGYESLELDDPPAAPPAPAPAAPEPPDDAAPDIASSVAARADAEPSAPPPRQGKGVLVGAAVAVAVVASVAIALLARGGASDPAGKRKGVRVTVTQELRWDEPPPLAPIDPSFVEHPRPAGDSPARAEAPPARPAIPVARPARGAPPSRPDAAALAPAPTEPEEAPPALAPEPSPVAAAPEPQPAQPPPAPVTPADVPLPPPPAGTSPRAAPVPVRAEAAAKVRAPVLETRTCVADALRVPRGLEGNLPGEVVMHVDVAEDGRPANVSFPGSVDPRLRTALVAAVRTCRFTPGADASGRPAAAATTMRLRFE